MMLLEILFAVWLVYGTLFGFNNFFTRLVWMFKGGNYSQNKLGEVLDWTFFVVGAILVYQYNAGLLDFNF